ncbi:MAG: HAMP domain-containing histidine kinase, partial [Lachnospiraceae bacterium]|nr:HAMP domain-containing histidine kinase [Lachnospiraceae bacterium]
MEKKSFFAPLKSLRVRIFIIVLLSGVLPGVFMRYGIVNSYETRAVENRINVVSTQLRVVANHLINNNYLVGYRAKSDSYLKTDKIIDSELEMLANIYDGRVMIIDSNFKVVKDTYGLSQGKIMISEEVIKCFRGDNISNYDEDHGYIEMTTPIADSTLTSTEGEAEVQGVMLTSISTESITATMEILQRNALVLEFIIIVINISLAIVLSGLLVRPFNKITDEVLKVKAGFSDEIISVPDYVETVHIVDAFNQVLSRIRTLDESRQEFVANVSHELKTPMASIKVLADSLTTQQDVPVEIYREFMEDITQEIDRENRIITDLLALVKMDKNVETSNFVDIDINELTELILKRLRPIARK